jgi:fluoride ion exporter CrcB/FEX
VETGLARDEIQRQMAVIRTHLPGEVGGIVTNVRRLADWRYYIRAFPLGSLAAAAAAGYLLVPHSSAKAGEAAPEPSRATAKPQKASVIGGLMGSLTTIGTNLLMKSAMSYVTRTFVNPQPVLPNGQPTEFERP